VVLMMVKSMWMMCVWSVDRWLGGLSGVGWVMVKSMWMMCVWSVDRWLGGLSGALWMMVESMWMMCVCGLLTGGLSALTKLVVQSNQLTTLPRQIGLVFMYYMCSFFLLYAVGPLSGTSCPPVALVYCGQTVGWIKIKLGIEVGLGPGHIVLDGT